jgi:hypothetical protein
MGRQRSQDERRSSPNVRRAHRCRAQRRRAEDAKSVEKFRAIIIEVEIVHGVCVFFGKRYRAPCRCVARTRRYSPHTSTRAPKASSPASTRSRGRCPMRSPPGVGTNTSPKRTSNGTMKNSDARVRASAQWRTCASRIERGSMIHVVASDRVTHPPNASITRATMRTSSTSGTFSKTLGPSAKSAAIMALKAVFFAPLMRTRPPRGRPPRTRHLTGPISPRIGSPPPEGVRIARAQPPSPSR